MYNQLSTLRKCERKQSNHATFNRANPHSNFELTCVLSPRASGIRVLRHPTHPVPPGSRTTTCATSALEPAQSLAKSVPSQDAFEISTSESSSSDHPLIPSLPLFLLPPPLYAITPSEAHRPRPVSAMELLRWVRLMKTEKKRGDAGERRGKLVESWCGRAERVYRRRTESREIWEETTN
ncbi:hypothetical protein NL676_038164 [Syzygium grande]|nr:hypothetical protein NL676_038164 [Syzygium grande]